MTIQEYKKYIKVGDYVETNGDRSEVAFRLRGMVYEWNDDYFYTQREGGNKTNGESFERVYWNCPGGVTVLNRKITFNNNQTNNKYKYPIYKCNGKNHKRNNATC